EADPRAAPEADTAASATPEGEQAKADPAATPEDARTPPAPPEAAARPKDGPPALSAAALRIIAADLDEAGAIQRLIDELPEEARRQPEYLEPFRLLVSAREAYRNLALVEDLLDPGWWIFGRVDEQEATLAYDIVMAMPLGERERFRQLDDGKALRRMLDALPRALIESPDFVLPEVARTADGKLIAADALYAPGGLSGSEAELVGETLTLFREAAAAEEADPEPRWNRLLAIAAGDPDVMGDKPARPDAVLATMVRRLDAEGLLAPVLAALPPDVLAARDTWSRTAAILNARDPVLAREHILRLLNESTFLWLFTTDAVEPGEALLAFQLVRALPPADREALEAAHGGEPWGRMLAGLSNQTLGEASFTWFQGELDRFGTNSIRDRINDDRLWARAETDPKALDQLIVLIEIARAAGEFAYVFDYSKLLYEAGRPAPQALTKRFALYDPGRGRTAPEPIRTSLESGESSFWRLLLGTGWREIETKSVTTPGPDILGSPYQDQSVSQVRVTVDLEQLEDALGGRLTPGVAVAKSGGERTAVSKKTRRYLLENESNIVDVLLNLETNHLTLRAPKLRFASLSFVTGGSILRTGPVNVDGLVLDIDFQKGDLIDLTNAIARLGELRVETPVYSDAGTIAAARRAVLKTLFIAAGDFSGDELREPMVGSFFGLVVRMAWRQFVSKKSYIGNPLERSALFDRLELRFDSLVVDEFQTSGGQRVGQVSVEGVRVAAATNRAAYQRLLIASLNERMAKATDPNDKAQLAQRLETAEAELQRLEGLEQEYRNLVRKMNRQGGRLDKDESQRLTDLQEKEGIAVASHMGAVVDIGRVAVSGVEGSVQVQDFAVTDLHGEGEFRGLAGFSAEQLTSEESIRRFVEFGPQAMQTQPENKDKPENTFALSLGMVNVNGLVVEADIPSAWSLLRQALELPAIPEFAAERSRLLVLAGRVLVYEGLRRMEEPEDPAQRLAHRRRILDQRRELARLFGGEVEHMHFTGVSAGAFPGLSTPEERRGREDEERLRDDAGFRIGGATLSGVRYGGYAADTITGTDLRGAVQLRQPGVDALGDPNHQVEVALLGGKEVVIENLRQGESPNRADKIVITNFDGTVRLTDHGLAVEHFGIENFAVEGAQYRTATSYLWSHGTTNFRGITVDLTIPFEAAESRNAEGETDDDPPAWSRLNTGVVRIQRLHVDAIEAGNLGYRGYDDRGAMAKEVEVVSGSLRDVNVTDFSLTMPKDGDITYSGGITVQTLDGVKFKTRMGEDFEATGLLGEGRKKRADDQPAIRIGLARSGNIEAEIDKVLLTDGVFDKRTESGSGRVLVRRANISALVGLEGDTIKVRSLTIPLLDMPRIDWRSNDGSTLTVTGAKAHDFRLRLDYTTESETKSTVVLHELYVGALRAREIIYDARPGVYVTLIPDAAPKGGYMPLIQGLLLQDLTVTMGAKSIGLSGGHGRIDQTSVIATFAANFETGSDPSKYEAFATAVARLSAKGFTFEDFGYGDEGLTLAGGVENLSLGGNGDFAPADPTAAPYGAVSASGDVAALDGRIGHFRIGNGLISIGSEDQDGLVFPEILLTGLSFDAGDKALIPVASQDAEKVWEANPSAAVTESGVTAKNLNLKMDIHLRKDTEPAEAKVGKAGKSELGAVERIDIHQLHFDSIALQGYRLYLRQKGVYIDIPTGIESSIGPIDLHGPLPDKPFRIEFNEAGTKALGGVLTGPLIARQIGVQMEQSLRARLDFQAASVSVGFLEAADPTSGKGGPIKIDLNDWSATNILAYLGEGTGRSLRAGRLSGAAGEGVGGKQLTIDVDEGGNMAVKLRGLWARGFTLKDKALGLTLKLDRATMPDDKLLSYVSGKDSPKGSSYSRSTIHVDKLDVDNADLTIDSLTGMLKTLGVADIYTTLHARPDASGGGTAEGEADTEATFISGDALDWVTQHEALFRSLEGSLDLSLEAFGGEGGLIHPSIALDIEHGRLDLDAFEDAITTSGDTLLDYSILGAANLTFDPNTKQPTLVFGFGGHMAVPSGGPLPDPNGPVYADFHYTLVQWPLRGDEYKIAKRSKTNPHPKIGIDTLLRAEDPDFGKPKDEDEEDDLYNQSIAEKLSDLRITDFKLKLSTQHKDPLTLLLGEYGSLDLAPNALQNLEISGYLQKANYRKGMEDNPTLNWLELKKTNRPGEVTMSLDSLAVAGMDLKLPAFAGYSGGSAKGRVTIGDADKRTKLNLGFSGLVPKKLDGRIGPIHLEDIEINLDKYNFYGPEEPTPEFEFDAPDVFTKEEKAK
ncbi:MAG: hypothetical protein KDC18_14185, partial [Alphaproteobacteria bacterium]|nr:hypothetical protein [Alphaproteobacteria bacterium]